MTDLVSCFSDWHQGDRLLSCFQIDSRCHLVQRADMQWRLRIEFAGAVYHVIARGNARWQTVRDHADDPQARTGDHRSWDAPPDAGTAWPSKMKRTPGSGTTIRTADNHEGEFRFFVRSIQAPDAIVLVKMGGLGAIKRPSPCGASQGRLTSIQAEAAIATIHWARDIISGIRDGKIGLMPSSHFLVRVKDTLG